jgi:uncharacterized protein
MPLRPFAPSSGTPEKISDSGWWAAIAGLWSAAGLINGLILSDRYFNTGFADIDLTVIITMVSVFAGAVAAGLAGFAFSAIAGAMLFHWLTPMEVVPLLLACSVTTQLFSIVTLWHVMRWTECLTYLAGGIVGIPIGASMLEHVSPQLFAGGFGLFLVGYAAYMLRRPSISIQCRGRGFEVLAGIAGGITGGATAFPGAVPTVLCSIRGVTKNEQRGIVQPFILIMQLVTLLYFSKLHILSSTPAKLYVWCVPAVMAGTWIGIRLFNKVDDARFRQLVLLFLLGSGALLVI